MDQKGKIVEYRERLDRTLASPDLTNDQMLKNLVKKQLLGSSQQDMQGYKDELVETKTAEVSNFLDMLRSASEYDNGGSSTSRTDWKLKSDNEEFRVMYREGPEGTPFHTLLVEGYVEGPADVCLCLSWETPLYKKWWPHTIVPAFKITAADCLHKVQIGEQISLVRMKLSWPLSSREAIVHYYLFEYFQDDLIVVLLKSVSDTKSMKGTMSGSNSDVIPEAKDVVRIDLVGGYAMQKVTSERSYFRTIATMDIKLDFVPPSLINFISRQLLGSGFRLYQKAAASMLNHDKEFKEALEDSMYVRVRQSLYSINGPKAMDGEEHNQVATILSADDLNQSKQEDTSNQQANNFSAEIVEVDSEEIVEVDCKEIVEASRVEIVEANGGEIVEAVSGEIVQIKENDKKVPIEEVEAKSVLKGKRNVHISSEVEQALGTLEKAISVVRKHGFHPRRSSSSFANEESRSIKKGGTDDSHSAKLDQLWSKTDVGVEVSNGDMLEETSQEEPGVNSDIPNSRHTQTNPNLKEVNYNKVVPASPEQNLSRPIEARQVASYSFQNGTTLNHVRYDKKQLDTGTVQNRSSDVPKKSSRLKNYQYCCFLR